MPVCPDRPDLEEQSTEAGPLSWPRLLYLTCPWLQGGHRVSFGIQAL